MVLATGLERNGGHGSLRGPVDSLSKTRQRLDQWLESQKGVKEEDKALLRMQMEESRVALVKGKKDQGALI